MTLPGSIEQQTIKRRFHTLDAARGLAALTVLTVHWSNLLHPFVFEGAQRAVDLFFVMSGFVIALNYDERLDGKLSATRFIIKRLIRLWPLHLLGTSLTIVGIAMALLSHVHMFWTWRELAVFSTLNLMMLPGPPDHTLIYLLFPLNLPSWSLFWEMVANYAYALSRRRLSDFVLTAIVALAAIFFLCSIVYYGNSGGGFDWYTVPQGFFRVTFGFFAGVLLYRWHVKGWTRFIRVPVWLSLSSIVLVLWVPTIAGSRAFADALLIVFSMQMLVAAIVESEPRRGAAFFTFLGVISYPIYTLHFAFAKYAQGFFEKIGHFHVADYAPYIGFALVIPLIGVCAIIERVYDQPSRDRLALLFRAR